MNVSLAVGTRSALLISAAIMIGLVAVSGCGSATSTAQTGSVATQVREASGADSAGGATLPSAASIAGGSAAVASSGAGSADAKSACALVTEQDASVALAVSPSPGALRSGSGTTQCTYGNGALIVTVSPQGKTLYDTSRKAIGSAPAGTWSDQSGIGDAAFEAHGGPVASVAFYKGSTYVAITLSGSTTTAPTDAALQVAMAAAKRI